MKYKTLGKTRIQIPAIGQGCMGIGGYLSQDSRQDDLHIGALKQGIELGMTYIDTAEGYGGGHSEELVGRAIRGIRNKVFVATKFSPEHNGYQDVLESAEQSLRRLGTDYIDLYQLHWPTPQVPLSETMRALKKLLKEGIIRHAGVCNLSLKELKDARADMTPEEIISIQVEYNLFDRTIENSILPYCRSEGMITVAYSPLDQGKIASGDSRIKVLQKIAGKYGRTIAQVALNWLISHPSVIAIPKATNPQHIKENASSTDFELTDEDFEKISGVFAPDGLNVPTDRIRVIVGGQGNRQVYQTIEDALENRLGFTPSPEELARDIRGGEALKPVRVIRSTDITGKYDYDLTEGRIRYWAWVIAYDGKKPIPVLIRDN
jgi:diketogulonate reductase-like aldo/keto reductase